VSLVSDVVTEITKLPGQVASGLTGIASSLAGSIGSAIKSAWNTAVDHLPSLDFEIPIPPHPHISISADFLKFAQGGVVPGMSSEELGAVLHGGEVVLNSGQQANVLMAVANNGVTGASQPSLVIQNAVFGADMPSAVAELSWAVRYRMRTVA
jgi:hypothetical protein